MFRYTGDMAADKQHGVKGVEELEFRARGRKEAREEKERERKARRHLPKHEIYGYPKDAHQHLIL